MFYTGIGARATPKNILSAMKMYAILLADNGYTLRSGGADGADTAFEQGCKSVNGLKEIYLPWKGFNDNKSSHYLSSKPEFILCEKAKEAYFENEWEYLKPPIKRLMERNVYQVLGETLDSPSEFVLCWTNDGCSSAEDRTRQTGGTGQAITVASQHGVPIFNIQDPIQENKLLDYLTTRDII